MAAPEVTIDRVEARAYRVPTDLPESDGTIEWDATTLVVAHVEGGGRRGIGYSYSSVGAVAVIHDELARALRELDPMDTTACGQAIVASTCGRCSRGLTCDTSRTSAPSRSRCLCLPPALSRSSRTPMPRPRRSGRSRSSPRWRRPRRRARGRIYYDYYCVFCHGTDGRGNGPVGQSYMPKPSDLTDPSVQRQSDGELLRKSLTGTGHEPVLARVIPPEHRWYLVSYVRSLTAVAETGGQVPPSVREK